MLADPEFSESVYCKLKYLRKPAVVNHQRSDLVSPGEAEQLRPLQPLVFPSMPFFVKHSNRAGEADRSKPVLKRTEAWVFNLGTHMRSVAIASSIGIRLGYRKVRSQRGAQNRHRQHQMLEFELPHRAISVCGREQTLLIAFSLRAGWKKEAKRQLPKCRDCQFRVRPGVGSGL